MSTVSGRSGPAAPGAPQGATAATGRACWVCGAGRLELARPAAFDAALAPDDFAITDSRYGTTGELWRCRECGFLQCLALEGVLAYYRALEDRGYEASRAPRALQMRKLLETLRPFCAGGRLLDVGAGSGILVEEALARGWRAEGIEPSRWLAGVARERGLPVHEGTLPSPDVRGPYDLVTLIDVIEHVPRPVELLARVRPLLAPGGVVAVVTPDLGSLAARWLGWRWWHFRIAHIGYFDRATLQRALDRADLRVEQLLRPAWYFSADYLCERLGRYLPGGSRLRAPRVLARLIFPLDLRDSWLAIARPKT